MSESQQTVFIVDDDESHLRSMRRLLRASGYEVESFSSAEEFLEGLPDGARGCVITDLKMPGLDGVQLQEALEGRAHTLPIIFLTGHGDVPTSVTAMRRGAEDFLLKTAPTEDLLAALERALVRASLQAEQQEQHGDFLAHLDSLTPRERDVLGHVLQGARNKRIARTMGISERSVKRHRTRIMRKLQVHSVAELVRLAVEAGLVEED